jgi:hypothetical protein
VRDRTLPGNRLCTRASSAFARLQEHNPTAKRQFLTLIFDGVWLDDGRVVAVQPKPSFLPFFKQQREEAAGTAGVKYGSDGVEAAFVASGIEIRL